MPSLAAAQLLSHPSAGAPGGGLEPGFPDTRFKTAPTWATQARLLPTTPSRSKNVPKRASRPRAGRALPPPTQVTSWQRSPAPPVLRDPEVPSLPPFPQPTPGTACCPGKGSKSPRPLPRNASHPGAPPLTPAVPSQPRRAEPSRAVPSRAELSPLLAGFRPFPFPSHVPSRWGFPPAVLGRGRAPRGEAAAGRPSPSPRGWHRSRAAVGRSRLRGEGRRGLCPPGWALPPKSGFETRFRRD